MGMCAGSRNAEQFGGSDIARCIESRDVGCACAPDGGIHFLRSSGTEFHQRLVIADVAQTCGFCRYQRLEIHDIQ
jgi:hypothetical protein